MKTNAKKDSVNEINVNSLSKNEILQIVTAIEKENHTFVAYNTDKDFKCRMISRLINYYKYNTDGDKNVRTLRNEIKKVRKTAVKEIFKSSRGLAKHITYNEGLMFHIIEPSIKAHASVHGCLEVVSEKGCTKKEYTMAYEMSRCLQENKETARTFSDKIAELGKRLVIAETEYGLFCIRKDARRLGIR